MSRKRDGTQLEGAPRKSRKETYGLAATPEAREKQKQRQRTAALKNSLRSTISVVQGQLVEKESSFFGLLEDAIKAVKAVKEGQAAPAERVNINTVCRRALWESPSIAVFHVSLDDWIVRSMSNVLQRICPWEHTRGYVGQALPMMLHPEDGPALEEFRLRAMQSPESIAGRTVLDVRLLRAGKDPQSSTLLCTFIPLKLEAVYVGMNAGLNKMTVILTGVLPTEAFQPLVSNSRTWESWYRDIKQNFIGLHKPDLRKEGVSVLEMAMSMAQIGFPTREEVEEGKSPGLFQTMLSSLGRGVWSTKQSLYQSFGDFIRNHLQFHHLVVEAEEAAGAPKMLRCSQFSHSTWGGTLRSAWATDYCVALDGEMLSVGKVGTGGGELYTSSGMIRDGAGVGNGHVMFFFIRWPGTKQYKLQCRYTATVQEGGVVERMWYLKGVSTQMYSMKHTRLSAEVEEHVQALVDKHRAKGLVVPVKLPPILSWLVRMSARPMSNPDGP